MYGFGLLDIVTVAESTGHDLTEVAGVYFAAVRALPGRRDAVAHLRAAARGPLADVGAYGPSLRPVRGAVGADREVLSFATATGSTVDASTSVDEKVTAWEEANSAAIARTRASIGEFDESRADLAVLSVLLRQIRTLVQTAAA